MCESEGNGMEVKMKRRGQLVTWWNAKASKRQHKYINKQKTFIRLNGIEHVLKIYIRNVSRWSRNIYTTKSLVFVEGQNACNNMNDDTMLVSELTVMATAPQNKKKIEPTPPPPLLLLLPSPPPSPSPPHLITLKAYQHCVTSNAFGRRTAFVVALLLRIFPAWH